MGKLLLAAILSGSLAFETAHAMDADSQNLLIDKLQKVYLTLAPNDPSKVAVTLRLADLYAERARTESMKADSGGRAVSDREKALRLYNEMLPRVPEASRAKVIMQMGHLHQMNGNEDKAIGFYQQNLKAEQDPQLLAESHLSLGEIFFKRRQYPVSLAHYDKVLALSKGGGRGLAAYRRAWSNFHLGKTDLAIKEIENVLNTPELLSRGTSGGNQIDPQFHEEVSRDYATFLSKVPITQAKIESLFKLSPESSRIDNTKTMAYDLERLGKKDDALMAWTFISGHLSQPADRLAAHLSMAQLHLDKLDKPNALKSYEVAMQSWKDVSENKNEAELKRRARNFVVAWNQTEKKKPSTELLSAYTLYLSVFGEDIDAQLYAAQIAKEQSNFAVAMGRYMTARDLLLKDKKAKESSEKLETVLLSQIELGEASKDPVLAQQAYASYLEYSPKKTKTQEVHYQMARSLYDKGDYAAASQELRKIALTGKGSADLRKQAANLSLDALVLMKNEAGLIPWAREYEKAFPQDKADFSHVVQKALLTKAASVAEADPAGALVILREFDPSKSSAEDKVKYYKNKLILADKQGEIKEASHAADSLLALPQASAEDKELAWGRKAYYAELRLDFSTAFAATEKLQKSLAADEKNFKLAMFAELSGRQSTPFYLTYLNQTKDDERKQLVAAELVRKSKSPEVELEKVKGMLISQPSLLAQLYAEVFAKNGKEAILKKVTADAKMRETDAGKLLARQSFLKDFAGIKKQIAADKFDTANNNKLAASIKRRAALLLKAEGYAEKSIQGGDWTAQLVSIDLMARESERFYQELLSAPMPQGLTPEEEQEYLNLLSAQATPYQTKASEAKAKVGQFWQADWSTPLTKSWEQKSIRKIIGIEIEALKEIAPQDQAAKLATFKDEVSLAARPSIQEMQLARQKVFENPRDAKAIEALMLLEKKSDNLAMSEYLATRLERLNKGTL